MSMKDTFTYLINHAELLKPEQQAVLTTSLILALLRTVENNETKAVKREDFLTELERIAKNIGYEHPDNAKIIMDLHNELEHEVSR